MTVRQKLSFSVGEYQGELNRAISEMVENKVVSRIWAFDHTVWRPSPDEISNRLGWLHIAEAMSEKIGEIKEFVSDVKSAGYTHALLLGMGGSSLAPEFFRKTFGVKEGYLNLMVLDSTDPGAVTDLAKNLDLEKTLFIVSTKSGTTIETLSFFKYFYNLTAKKLGEDRAGKNFIAITDPESSLINIAERLKFRSVFLNDPNIGGRYSALSYFGLVPAALIGMDIEKLLEMASVAAANSKSSNSSAAQLGALFSVLFGASRDKATFIISKEIAPFGDWVEQLIAESTGKGGVGILPVVDEPPGDVSLYSDDRFFVYMELKRENLNNNKVHDLFVNQLEERRFPVVRITLSDLYDLGGQLFLWEMAVAISGHFLGINPFDQPDVESAKALAKGAAARYKEEGSLPTETPTLNCGEITVYGGASTDDPEEALLSFFNKAKPGAYVALMAYLAPGTETTEKMSLFRERIRDRFGFATTFGYGPRFLHSTGQLHKGDSGNGLFIQFTADNEIDIPVPDEAGINISTMTFGVLKTTQAMGDRTALVNAGREVIRFHLGKDIDGGLDLLLKSL